MLADSAYGSGEFRAHLVERGHRDVVKPAPLRPAVPGGFTVDDFTVDHADARVTARRVDSLHQSGRQCAVRRRVRRLCPPGPLHHRDQRQVAEVPTARRTAKTSSPTSAESIVAQPVPSTPADGGTFDRVAHPRQPQSPLPRRREERSLASSPQRRVEPAPPARDGPNPHRHHLGTGLSPTTSRALPSQRPMPR